MDATSPLTAGRCTAPLLLILLGMAQASCDDAAGGGAADAAAADGAGDSGTADALDETAAGDSAGDTDGADALPPGDPTWHDLAPLGGGARQEHAVLAVDGEVWVLGGFMGLSVVDSVEIYSPEDDAWRAGPALPAAMHHINATVVGDRIYITGFLTGLFVPDGRVYWRAIGAEGGWTPGTDMSAGTERGASAVAVLGTTIYVAGGLVANLTTTAAFSAYHTESEEWEALPDVPSPRDHFSAAILGGLTCVVGGRNGGVITGAVDCWDAERGEWEVRAPMLTPRAGMACALLDGRFYALGGEGNPDAASGVFPQVEVYDAAADAWSALADMPTPRHGFGAAVVGRRIDLPGGGIQQNFGAADVHDALEIPAAP